MVRLIPSENADPSLKWAAAANNIAQTLLAAGHLSERRREFDTEQARYQRAEQVDAEERKRQHTREDVQDVQRAELHQQQIGALDWQAKRREIEQEQEEAAQEGQAKLYADAFGEELQPGDTNVPAVVQRRLAKIKGELGRMSPEEQRRTIANEYAQAHELISQRSREDTTKILDALEAPDPDTGEPMLDPQRAMKYRKMLTGGVDANGRQIRPGNPDEVRAALLEFVRQSAHAGAHADMRGAAVARLDQAFVDAEGLSQQTAKYGIPAADPARVAEARALQRMLKVLPFDAKTSAVVEQKALDLIFGRDKGAAGTSKGGDSTLDEFKALAPDQRTPEMLQAMRRSQRFPEQEMQRTRGAYEAVGGDPSTAAPAVPATSTDEDVPSTEHAIAVADATKGVRLPQLQAMKEEAKAAGVPDEQFPAWAKAKVTRQARLGQAKDFIAQFPGSTPQEFQAFVETGATPKRLPPETPQKAGLSIPLPRASSSAAPQAGKSKDIDALIDENSDTAPVREWLKKNPKPIGSMTLSTRGTLADWRAKARKELGEWLGLE